MFDEDYMQKDLVKAIHAVRAAVPLDRKKAEKLHPRAAEAVDLLLLHSECILDDGVVKPGRRFSPR